MSPSDDSTANLFAKTALNAWRLNLDSLDRMFKEVSDDGLQKEIAPGKNRIFYLLGHLTAVHDRMLPLLGLGKRLHAELDGPFLTSPDRSNPDAISATALRHAYATINETLTKAMEALPAQAWLEKHEAVSVDAFAQEPLRNRLAVLLSRTAHAQFHAGQIRLAVKSGGD
jgi:hypothetical protein